MSYIGSSPKLKRSRYIPQSADPNNPSEGDFFYSDGTARPEGLWVYKNGAWELAGSQTGIGEVNYITNNGALSDTSGWATYADAAGVAPVDGTGGSPNVTWTRSNQPVRGTHSFAFAKDAANRQGQGVSYDFDMDLADTASSKQMWVSFDYYGTVPADQLQVYVYDKDGAVVYNVYNDNSGIIAPVTADSARFVGWFNSVAGNDNYRLIIHVRGTSATSYTLYFDNFKVSPSAVVPGAIITEWQSFTPTGSWSTNTTYTGRYRRVGDSAEFDVVLTLAGAPNAADLSINIPAIVGTIDTNKVSSSTANRESFGTINIDDSGVRRYLGGVIYASTSSVATIHSESGNAGIINNTNPITFGANDSVSLRFKVPISGWSPSMALSTTETMMVASKGQYTGDPASATAGNPIIFPTKTFEVGVGSYSTSTGLYTVGKTGYYRLSGSVLSVTNNVALNAFVDSTNTVTLGYTDSNGEGTFTGVVRASANQTISLRPGNTLDLQSGSVLNIEYIPDFTVFSVYGPFEVLTTSSGTKTPAGNNQYQALTNNSLTLTPGVWELFGNIYYGNGGAAPAYTQVFTAWYSANGADSGVAPAALSAASNLTILSSSRDFNLTFLSSVDAHFQSAPPWIVRVTAPVTIYLVSFVTAGTVSNARVNAYVNAKRLQ